MKYLTKKFLKKQSVFLPPLNLRNGRLIVQLRDWLRVISTSKGVYELRFFNVELDDEEGDDDE